MIIIAGMLLVNVQYDRLLPVLYYSLHFLPQGLDYCHVFCHVCFFPRLQDFIMNQDWNDPKSKLQQCCLTLRTMEGGEPDIPVYKYVTKQSKASFCQICEHY